MTELRAALLYQAKACEALGSPFMGRLMRLLAAHWPRGSVLDRKLAGFTGDIGPRGASLPLRIAGGLHALVLKGLDADLNAVYPPNDPSDDLLNAAVVGALTRHAEFLGHWCDSPPQTNEIRRSAVLIAAGHLLADRFGLPLMLSELGASGGLNLNWDRFALTLGTESFGPADPVLTLSPEWDGPLPPPAPPVVIERRGVDLNPLDATTADGALRLMAYLWPDQPERLTRTRAAITAHDAVVDKGDAIDWLETRLQGQDSGTTHMIYTTVAWQYFPKEAQAHGMAMIKTAGKKATQERPLAWFSMEQDGGSPGAGLRLQIWPAGEMLDLGRASFHGEWVDWKPPVS